MVIQQNERDQRRIGGFGGVFILQGPLDGEREVVQVLSRTVTKWKKQ